MLHLLVLRYELCDGDVSASVIWRSEDVAEEEKASQWAGRDPEMEILGMARPDVGAEGVWGGRCLGVSLGIAAIRRVGSFRFLSKAYRQNCICLRINFFQNMKQKKKYSFPEKSFSGTLPWQISALRGCSV